FTVSLKGLSVKTADDGTVQFVDSAGKALFAIPAGVAVDSAGDPARGVAPASPVAQVRLIPTTDTSVATIVGSVDRKWLSDPAREFPVTIDPTISGCGATDPACVAGDAYVSSTATTTNYNGAAQYDSGSGQYWDRVGKTGGTNYYSFLQFPDLSALRG